MNAVLPADDYSKVVADPKLLQKLLEHIRHSTEIIMEVGRSSFRIKSFHHTSNDKHQHRYMTSDITSPLDTFDMYDYKSTSEYEELIFSLKELRSLLVFSEPLEGSELMLKFTNCGNPIEFVLKQGFLEIKLMLATLSHPSQVTALPDGEEEEDYTDDLHRNDEFDRKIEATRMASRHETEEMKSNENFNIVRKRKKTFLDDDEDDL